MTSFYSWRLMFLTFFGKARGNPHTHDHAHESPNVMLIPLGVLAVGAIFAGMIWYGSFFGGGGQAEAWFNGAVFSHHDHHVLHAAHEVPIWVKISPFIAMISGLVLAYIMYIRSPEMPAKLAKQQTALHQFLLNK